MFAQSTIIYVDQAKENEIPQPAQDGMTWATPFWSLDAAVSAVSNAPDTAIYVAEGTYSPGGSTTAPRTSTYSLPSGLTLIGGFQNGDLNPSARTGSPRRTILSGEIQDDNDPLNNAFHVLTAEDGTAEIEIDGFTIRDGQATNPGGPPMPGIAPEERGGGIVSLGSDLRLTDCFFVSNVAVEGGAVWFEADRGGEGSYGGFRAVRCYFYGNRALERGGAINFQSIGVPATLSLPGETEEPSWIYSCQFERNLAGTAPVDGTVDGPDTGGGAIHFGGSRPEAAQIPFDGATAENATMLVVNSEFHDNLVHGRGAAVWLKPAAEAVGPGRIIVAHSTMALNTVLSTDSASQGGGTVHVEDFETAGATATINNGRSARVVNCIITDQVDVDGQLTVDNITGVGSYGNSSQDIFATPPAIPATPGGLFVTFSNVELASGIYGGGAPPTGNINQNPQFVSLSLRDFRLQASSPSVDTGSTSLGSSSPSQTRDYPDLDDDPSTTVLPVDLRTSTRVVGGRVDMGCFERQP